MTASDSLMTCGMHCLSGLSVWDTVFQDNTPYKIVAAIIAGKPVLDEHKIWMSEREEMIRAACTLLDVSSGALVACSHILTAIRMSYESTPNPQFVYNCVAKAHSAIERARSG